MKKYVLVATLLLLPSLAPAQALTRARLAEDSDVQARVSFLAVKVALSVMAENPDTCCGADVEASRAQYVERARLAAYVIRDPRSVAYRIALAVLTNVSLNQNSTDADLEATVRTQWNAYAASLPR